MVEPIGVLAPGARDPEVSPPPFDTTVPHSSRMYDYLLGGKDNFAADREDAPAAAAVAGRVNQRMRATPMTLRSRGEVSRFFDGLDVLPPGIVSQNRWPDPAARYDESHIGGYGAVGRKPG